MEIFTFDRAERAVTAHGSTGLTATRIAHGPTASADAFLARLSVIPGGVIGTHPAAGPTPAASA